MLKLKYKDLPKLRDYIRKEQDNRCVLCDKVLKNDAVLDHAHTHSNIPVGTCNTGMVRGVLCRNCNTLEGKILRDAKRYLGLKATTPAQLERSRLNLHYFLLNLSYYLEKGYYTKYGQLILHPTETKNVADRDALEYFDVDEAIKIDGELDKLIDEL